MNTDKQRILDLSTTENKADAKEALPALFIAGITGNQNAVQAAGEVVGMIFAEALQPSFDALQRMAERKAKS